MARPKLDKVEEQVNSEDISKNVLGDFLNTNKDSHYNNIEVRPVRISSGSLNLDSHVKITSGIVVRLVGAGAELGKSVTVDTNVLTPDGWARIGDIRVGDAIIGGDNGVYKVLEVHPQGKKKVNKVVFSDGTFVFCCDEHLWLTKTIEDRAIGRDGQVKATEQIKHTIIKNGIYNHSIKNIPNLNTRDFNLYKYIVDIEDVLELKECICIKVSSPDSQFIIDGFNLTHNTSESLVLAQNYMDTMPKAKTLFIKAEGRLSEDMQRRSGMKYVTKSEDWTYGTVFILKSNIFETIANLVIDLLKSMYDNGEHLCIIIDSMDGLILDDDSKKKIGENAKVAGVPLLTKLLFRKLALPIESYNALMLITGQYSAEIKLDPYAKNTPRMGDSSGGSSIGHQASVVLSYAPRYGGDYILEDPDGKPDPIKNKTLGVYASVEVKKSMNEATNIGKIRIPIKKGVIGPAIWKEKEVSDMLLMFGLAIKKGAWIEIKEELVTELKEAGLTFESKHNGINKLNLYFEENAAITKYLFDKFVKMLSVD